MALLKERKSALISDYRRSETDTGSPEVQVAILTKRIEELTEHLKTHKKDHAFAARAAADGRPAAPAARLPAGARTSSDTARSSRAWDSGARTPRGRPSGRPSS